MTFKPLQRLNFMKRVGFSLIVIMIAFIIMVEVIDKSIIHLTLFDYRNQYSLATSIVFVVITSAALFVQSIFLSKIYSTKLFIGKLNLKILYNIPLICHLVTIIVVIFLMIEIIFESRYGKFLILISIWLNVSIGISILAGLVFRLIVWLKERLKKKYCSYLVCFVHFSFCCIKRINFKLLQFGLQNRLKLYNFNHLAYLYFCHFQYYIVNRYHYSIDIVVYPNLDFIHFTSGI